MAWTGKEGTEIEIRGKRWRWTMVGAGPRRGRHAPATDRRAFVAFRDPDDPVSEMRCAVPPEVDEELTEETLRELFDRAWAVRS